MAEEELKDLFTDTGASFEGQKTPNVVTWKTPISSAPSVQKEQDSTPQKAPKQKTPRKRKPYVKKPKKPTYDEEMRDFIAPDPSTSLLQDLLTGNAKNSDAATEPPPQPPPQPSDEAAAQEKIAEEKKLKKKKESLKHLAFSSFKELGKGDNDIKAELKRIDYMSADDVDFEHQKHMWTQTEHFTDCVAAVVRDGAGYLIDKLLAGDGVIKEEFKADPKLKEALHKELMGYTSFFGPKSQILVLTAGNVMNAKAKQNNQKAHLGVKQP